MKIVALAFAAIFALLTAPALAADMVVKAAGRRSRQTPALLFSCPTQTTKDCDER